MNFSILAPNISFDFYKITAVKLSKFAPAKFINDKSFHTGFLTLDPDLNVIPV